jgi:hypothetical protein
MPGEEFVRSWEIKNIGECTWPTDVDVVMVAGYEADVTEQTRILPLEPGEIMELTMTFVSPQDYGTYESVWQLEVAGSNRFGDRLTIEWQVGPTPTPRPSATATPTPTPTLEPTLVATATPAEPFHIDISGINNFEDLTDGTWRADIYIHAYGGTGEYRYYLNGVDPANELESPAFEIRAQQCKAWVGTVIVVSGDEQIQEKRFFDYPGTACD